ncbi:uncharacterized protein LAESUDRAFT_720540 [Laetiporus sulphureus 93-53]|uniref:DNA-(apurinic or apyrimidinic site) endonuclease n=1 Tax=Laetiporus sulphureus 93-53 TaxID=1314785 RepID=A0A165H6S7_9APHY|nr:uncharacterized protein LAESUDRAFT_720540 [Laetiporus sulphureus 93-53]KZT11321.1 hypothetical protein LAESUDRAFT_720540 [Laetiporus sulphureus 93-53]
MSPKRASASSPSRKRKLTKEEEDSRDEYSDLTEEESLPEDIPSEKKKVEKPASKRRASKKAKVEEDEESEEESTSKKGKKTQVRSKAKSKAKADVSEEEEEEKEGETTSNKQPTNKVLPVHISFPPRAPGTIRIASWNVSGLAAAEKKGFRYYLEAEDPDLLILTETKVGNEPVNPLLSKRFSHRYWSISSTKGYAGTAILSKTKPLSVSTELPGHPDPTSVKGRILTLEFETCYVVGTYVVNAGRGLKTLDAKNEWNKHFTAYIRALDAKKPVIWGGDLNVAPTEKDLSNPKPNWNKTAGYTEAETSAFARILEGTDEEGEDSTSEEKFVDIWRELHPDTRHYTYFSYRFNCRMKGIGWRLDMFVVSARLVEKVRLCEIRSEIYGASDHCPVILEIEGEL